MYQFEGESLSTADVDLLRVAIVATATRRQIVLQEPAATVVYDRLLIGIANVSANGVETAS
jgi:hypothetical protein